VLPALVLTAGLGARLDPLTRLRAKPAMPMGDRTLVELILEWLRGQGVSDAVLNLHHRSETITAIVGDGAHLGVRVRYSWERQILGSAGGPKRAAPLLGSTFLIVNGDTLCEFDLAAMAAAHARSGAVATLAVVPNHAPARYNGILADDQQRITSFVPKGPEAAGSWHFIGVQIVSASVFDDAPADVPVETVAGVYRDRVAQGRGDLGIFPVDAPFVDIGTPQDYFDACMTRAQGGNGATAATAPLAHIKDSVIWPGARIGAGATLDRAVVTTVTIPRGFAASNAIIVPASVLRSGDAAEIVGDLAVFPLQQWPTVTGQW
jgi:mannose-1-phosphate guanylyltransferase